MSQSTRHVIGEIYCEVLFELAEEASAVEGVMADVEAVKQILHENPEFASILNSRSLKGKERSQILRRVFEGKVSPLALDFLSVLVRRGRIAFLADIADKYSTMMDSYLNRSPIEVTVAKQMSDDQREKLKEKLSEAIKGQVKLSVNVDPDIIGGIVIKKHDKIIDGSVKSALKRAVQGVVDSALEQDNK